MFAKPDLKFMCPYKFDFYLQIALIYIGCVSYLTVERVCAFRKPNYFDYFVFWSLHACLFEKMHI